MPVPNPQVVTKTEQVWGLKLPDGKEIWPPELFYGMTFLTEDERRSALEAIITGIDNMHLLQLPTLVQYQWMIKEVTTTTWTYTHSSEVKTRPIDDYEADEEDEDEEPW